VTEWNGEKNNCSFGSSIKTPPVIINLMLKAKRGDIESRTILIAMKLDPTVTDKVIITTQSLNWFILIHT
jgi:hypothetical protein